MCGVDLAVAASGEVAAPARSAWRIVAGIVFLGLAGCCVLPIPRAIARAENVSAMIGSILPSLICLIIGLMLLKRPQRKA